jgi:hypothetical protein
LDRRDFLRNACGLLAVGGVPTSLLGGGRIKNNPEDDQAARYREIYLDRAVTIEDGVRMFQQELELGRGKHPVYVLFYQEGAPQLPAYRRAAAAVLQRRGYRGAVLHVDIDKHAALAADNVVDVAGKPYVINASLAAYVDGKRMAFYRTSVRSQVDGTRFAVSYPGIAGMTAVALGDGQPQLESRIAGFVERTDQAFGAPTTATR